MVCVYLFIYHLELYQVLFFQKLSISRALLISLGKLLPMEKVSQEIFPIAC